jgi:queuine tRNA-ribosyltransferase
VPPFAFQVQHADARSSARRGLLTTAHGAVETPAFMPVGTQGTVKGVLADQLRASGAQMILGNTYHLALRPGADVVRDLGGLHAFCGWTGPILTDSGGFQVFSLSHQAQVSEEGVVFRSHVDGRNVQFTPERVIHLQQALGSDIAMVLDHVVRLPNDRGVIRDASQRSIRWARRSQSVAEMAGQVRFAIVQGGLEPDLRAECAEALVACDFPGYAIGGLSVGETPDQMYRVLDATCPLLPEGRPRYLMGVGRPQDVLQAIARGVDLFDCVMPTRNGRNALAFTDQGPLRLRNQQYQRDPRPVEEGCACPACRHSRGYLRHLFLAREMLGPVLLSIHNLTYYLRLLRDARLAIAADRFQDLLRQKLSALAGREDKA